MYNDLFIEENLPKPLTEDELKSYFLKMKAGDSHARDEIIKHNIKLVLDIVLKKFNNTYYEKSELVSIGLVALVRSVDTYDISKGSKFSTYAFTCINNEILLFIRRNKKYLSGKSIDDIAYIDKDGNTKSFEECICDDVNIEKNYEDYETMKILMKLVNELTPREKTIVMLYFGFYDGVRYSEKEIGDKLNITRSYVSKILIKVLNNLSKGLEEYGIISYSNQNKTPSRRNSKTKNNIYEFFKDFSSCEVDEVLSKLSDDEQAIIKLRFNNDTINALDSSERIKFYGVISKIKRLLGAKNIENNKTLEIIKK